jgi:hypothetical protein
VRRRDYGSPADEATLHEVAAAVGARGIAGEIVDDATAARRRVLELVPPGSAVLTATSRTLELCGLLDDVERSGRYRSVRAAYLALDKQTQRDRIRRLRAAPDVILGSVHAVTRDGRVVIASESGSQLGPYAYGAGRVIWVAGAQKIVADLDEALRRIEEHAFPLEDARARAAYGTGSGINKVLIVAREIRAGRTTLILVRQAIGF